MLYEFKVTERYPNGETWTHYFSTLEEAQWAVEDLEEAHKGREYVISPVAKETA